MKKKIIQTKGRKKNVTARLRMMEGNGEIKINGVLLQFIKPQVACDIVSEPIKLAEEILGKGFSENLNIDIKAAGGGVMGQAYACRTAIGKAILDWSENESLRKLYGEYDRSIFIDDIRQVESKKPLRKGARAKPTKSYR